MSSYVVLPGDRSYLRTFVKMQIRHDRDAGLRCPRHGRTPWLERAPGCEACFLDLQAALRDMHRCFTQWKDWNRRLAEWLGKAEPLGRA